MHTTFIGAMTDMVETFLGKTTGATSGFFARDVVNGYESITNALNRLNKPHDAYLRRVRDILNDTFEDDVCKAERIAALRIDTAMASFPKIEFIKAIRQAVECTLKEAKDAADAITAGANFDDTLRPMFDRCTDRRVKLELERLAASDLTGDALANALRDVLNVVAPF